jgi:hypothetical protein
LILDVVTSTLILVQKQVLYHYMYGSPCISSQQHNLTKSSRTCTGVEAALPVLSLVCPWVAVALNTRTLLIRPHHNGLGFDVRISSRKAAILSISASALPHIRGSSMDTHERHQSVRCTRADTHNPDPCHHMEHRLHGPSTPSTHGLSIFISRTACFRSTNQLCVVIHLQEIMDNRKLSSGKANDLQQILNASWIQPHFSITDTNMID